MRAALRRYARLGGIAGNSHSEGMQSENDVQVSDKESIYQTGGLILNDKTKSVTIDGVDAGLTAREFSILKLLMTNIEHVLSSSQIYEAVWGEPAFDVSKTISVHIRHIREKIEINPKEPRYLKVIYGLGYKVVKLK